MEFTLKKRDMDSVTHTIYPDDLGQRITVFIKRFAFSLTFITND